MALVELFMVRFSLTFGFQSMKNFQGVFPNSEMFPIDQSEEGEGKNGGKQVLSLGFMLSLPRFMTSAITRNK